ncbi:xylulokinase [Beijerinckia indica]|uniref:Xylulose kinase n=1 Tax=Beijerinckia indica subsp. indica (strain ATCC 9039 / DSM 1715 / NCIMB 8712) TaxID=395963 RepID=B2ILE8_BEII9|nr:xylulokinase [Beijerinckia indica]ACB97348.1 xylulokinase [Beijerinckia indica subsp. indica ATCC 9039]
MFLGIDIGTSAVKSVLVDADERILATASEPLQVSRPQPGWSEQDPDSWVSATLTTLDALKMSHGAALARVEGIGLSGQMHGATLLGPDDRPLRPCILWNDGRSTDECVTLTHAVPELSVITGNLAMSGFTAPKLLWVRQHEPDIFRRIATVLLPKAYVRLALTGEKVDEMSDAAGTLWLDVAARDWSNECLAATDLSRAQMPRLIEGSEPSGRLRSELAARYGMTTPPVVAGGAGDNAAGAVGLGAIRSGDAFVSLGTSGIVWATTNRFAANPSSAVHAFCHALPGLWHQMGVMLSAASCLSWWARIVGRSEADLLAELPRRPSGPGVALFQPYLSGERTPHNDASLRGAFAELAHETDRPALTQAVLEGVAYGIRDCLDALSQAGTRVESATVIGGGSRTHFWVALLADVLGLPLHRVAQGEVGAAFGAARLGRLAATGESPTAVCRPPAILETIVPTPAFTRTYAERYERWRNLYPGRT